LRCLFFGLAVGGTNELLVSNSTISHCSEVQIALEGIDLTFNNVILEQNFRLRTILADGGSANWENVVFRNNVRILDLLKIRYSNRPNRVNNLLMLNNYIFGSFELYDTPDFIITNSNFIGNTSNFSTYEGNKWPQVYNCIFQRNKYYWGYTIASVLNPGTSYAPVHYHHCLTDGNTLNAIYDSTTLRNTVAEFVDTLSGNYELSPCSPGVDAGSNDIVNMVNLTTDITGAQRIQGERVDMGAYERPAPGLAQLPLVGAACAGSTGGHILLDPVNGCEPYTYTWYPAAGTGPELADVPAGEYHFTITDSRGRSFSDTLTVPSAPSVQLTPVVSDIICGSVSGGVVAAVVSGGTPPFQYSWSNGYADSLQTGMHPGSYTVAVSDASGCTDSESVSVSLSGQLTLYVNGGPIVCSGDHNGFLSAAALNGRPPFDYLWSPFGQTDSLIEQLGPGDYSVTVNDTYGCSSSFSYHLDDPSVLVPHIISQACSNPLFPNGTAYTYADGGVQPHKYLWSNGGTTQQITGLSAGVYEVTITDAHGCTVTDSVEIKLLSGTESESVAELRVWPNPASEYATVEGSALREGDQVSLYSLTGQALQRSEVSGGKAVLKLPLLPAGVYRWQWEQAGTVRKSGLLEKL
jgi:hypothetical protein